MLPWLMGIVLCLALLAGCGGGNANLVKMQPLPEETVALAPDVPDEPLTEELNSKRLEELYAKSGIPGWDPSLEEELKQWEHQVKFDVPIQMNKQVRAYLVYFSTERKGVIRNYLSRSTRYLPMIKEVFDEYGLPEDLAYLAMIESGFNNKATSPAAACGMWQFIKGTGLRYGLTIDSYRTSVGTLRKPPGSRPNISWTSTSSSAPGIWRPPLTTAAKAGCSGSWTRASTRISGSSRPTCACPPKPRTTCPR